MFFRVIKQAAFGKFRLPVHLILHVTYRCNSFCQTCFNWRNLNVGKADMDISEFEKLSKGLGELIWLHISGGEPFLRNDLPDICELFANNNRPSYINIPTAGFEPHRIEKLGEEILRRIKIPTAIDLSLDDLGKRHDEIRDVGGSFDNLLESYRILMHLKKRFEHLSVKVATVISSKNFDNLEEILNFVYYKMKGVSFHTIVFMRGNPRNPHLTLPHIKRLVQKAPAILRAWEHYDYDDNFPLLNRVIANAAHEVLLGLYFKMMEEKKRCIPCLAGIAHGVIGADGEVSFCELLDSIGNIRDYDFDFNRLWRSSKAEERRRFVKSKNCWCTHGCVHMDNLFFNIRRYPSLIKNTTGYMFRYLKKIRKRNEIEKGGT